MKEYYYDNYHRKKAADKFNKLENAIMVTQDKLSFDIISKNIESCFEYTKKRLGFEDARECILNNAYPVIFCGVHPYFEEELKKAPSDYNEPRREKDNPFFVEDSDSILKVSVTISEEELKSFIYQAFEKETEYKKGMHKNFFVPFKDFFLNEELYNVCKYPLIINSYGDVKLPDYGYGVPSLFYSLNDLYSEKDTIHISPRNLENVYKSITPENEDIVSEFINSLCVTVINKYDKEELSHIVDYMTDFGYKENIKLETLNTFRNILNESALNSEIFNKLHIEPKITNFDAQKKHTIK